MFAEGVLPRATKEHIATLVARDAGCRYCVDAHVLFLDLIGGGPDVVLAARVASVDDMPIDEKLRELLRFVRRIDFEVYKIVDADLDRLWNSAGLTMNCSRPSGPRACSMPSSVSPTRSAPIGSDNSQNPREIRRKDAVCPDGANALAQRLRAHTSVGRLAPSKPPSKGLPDGTVVQAWSLAS